MKKVASDRIASALGNSFEWYDFALYGFLAPLLAQLYFPAKNNLVSLISAFGIFAAGFAARPIGAFVFGYVGDKYGRTVNLKLIPLLITIPTLLLPLIPPYEQIGITATLLFVAARIAQGICIGGESGNAIIYLCETAPAKRHYFYGSLASCAASFGILLASGATWILHLYFSVSFITLWGWRILFFIGIVINIFSYITRKNISETPVYKNLVITNKTVNLPPGATIKNEWKNVAISLGIMHLHVTSFYFVFVFLPSFLSHFYHIKTVTILGDNASSLCLRLLLIPMVGWLSDRIGVIKLVWGSCFCFFIFSYPLLLAIHKNIAGLTTSALYIFSLLTTLNAGTIPGLLVKLLKPQTRCTILSFSFNISFGIFGGLVPFISFLLINKTGITFFPVFYLMLAAMVTFFSTFYLQRKNLI